MHNRDECNINIFLLLLFTAMASLTCSKNNLYLICSTKEALCSTKLPFITDVMAVYLHRLKLAKMKHDAAIGIKNMVIRFWDKARISTRTIDHITKQLEELVQKWKGFKKNKARRAVTQVA